VSKLPKWNWVLDFRNWGKHLAVNEDEAERKSVGPFYVVYFSYVLHSCYKDMLKSAGRKGGPQQMIFDLHHLITVALVGSSINYGGWRAGAVTRLLHDFADIVLYASKLRQAIYETRGGHPSVMDPWFYSLISAWFSSRIVAYGWFCTTIIEVWRDARTRPNIGSMMPYSSMLGGSWAMWVLQVVFFKGVVSAAKAFWKNGGVINDPFHGTTAIARK
jgi:hypothetical protein